MLQTIEIVSILLVALAMAPALAHLLEFPGKSRLTKDAYLTVQPIYYPGFTIAGGIGEVGGLIAVLSILLLTPQNARAFWLRLGALAALLGMQIVFLLFTQPVNKFWLQSSSVGSFGEAFFNVGSGTYGSDDPDGWKGSLGIFSHGQSGLGYPQFSFARGSGRHPRLDEHGAD
jgi:hypothetical protein